MLVQRGPWHGTAVGWSGVHCVQLRRAWEAHLSAPCLVSLGEVGLAPGRRSPSQRGSAVMRQGATQGTVLVAPPGPWSVLSGVLTGPDPSGSHNSLCSANRALSLGRPPGSPPPRARPRAAFAVSPGGGRGGELAWPHRSVSLPTCFGGKPLLSQQHPVPGRSPCWVPPSSPAWRPRQGCPPTPIFGSCVFLRCVGSKSSV